MTVTFELEQDFPADLTNLWRALGQRDYVESKYRGLGSRDLQIIRLDSGPDRIEVELERDIRIASADVPSWARWLFAGRRRLRHRSRWLRREGGRVHADIEVSSPGQPVRAVGTGELVEVGPELSRMSLRFRVECDVPVMGPKIAGLFAKLVERALEVDHDFTVRYLTTHRTR
jgi:hypothetical protein